MIPKLSRFIRSQKNYLNKDMMTSYNLLTRQRVQSSEMLKTILWN